MPDHCLPPPGLRLSFVTESSALHLPVAHDGHEQVHLRAKEAMSGGKGEELGGKAGGGKAGDTCVA